PGVRHEHEPRPADYRVEVTCQVERGEVRLGEFDLWTVGQQATCSVEGGRIAIDGQHVSVVSDEIGGQRCDSAGSGADVEHPHPLGDSGVDEQSAGQRVEYGRWRA